MTKFAILWFRNDLRIVDNVMFSLLAFLKVQHVVPVIPNAGSPTGLPRSQGEPAKAFRLECIADLVDDFSRRYGMPCVVSSIAAASLIPTIASRLGDSGVVIYSREFGSEEANEVADVDRQLPAGWTTQSVWNYSLFHPDDLPFTRIPSSFTLMRRRIEDGNVQVRRVLPTPSTLPSFPPNVDVSDLVVTPLPSTPSTPMPLSKGLHFIGGSTAGLARLEEFAKNGLATYKQTRNDSLGWSYSSKLSPYLAQGCLSPRQVYYRIRQFEKENQGQTDDTYWMIFELMWRDYMRFYCDTHGPARVFAESGPAGKIPEGVWWKKDEATFASWCNGKMGIPFLDAHMVELVKTGFMSNRGRQNVASYLIHQLHVDWRLGAEFFQTHLVDHDLAVNYGNWLALAGVAEPGMRINRFNWRKQAGDYDPEGKHAKYWLDQEDKPKEKIATRPVVRNKGTLDIYFVKKTKS
jgi:deoxyribodipyrimidine photo-lyase